MSQSEIIERFVVESNLIEGYAEVAPDDPIFRDHLQAAELAASDPRWAAQHPAMLHALIMHAQPEVRPGFVRDVDVSVGGRICPSPVIARERFLTLGGLARFADLSSRDIWALHYDFEVIHPFRDGNGRTGRLWYNALRLVAGKGWLVFPAADRERYYEAINLYERTSQVTELDRTWQQAEHVAVWRVEGS